MTTGGITMETASTYLDAGSALVRKDLVESTDWAGITEETISWVTSCGK